MPAASLSFEAIIRCRSEVNEFIFGWLFFWGNIEATVHTSDDVKGKETTLFRLCLCVLDMATKL